MGGKTQGSTAGAGECNVSTAERSSTGEDPFTQELRFLLTRGETARFLDALDGRTQIATFDPEHPVSYTRTTYFDTADAAYLGSSTGEPARRLRVRQYAAAARPDEPPVFSGVGFIELKQHLGASRTKIRLAATSDEMATLLKDPRAAVAGAPANHPLTVVARELAIPTMGPRLSTWYRRVHLVLPDAMVRLTLDEGLQFCRPQAVGRAGMPAAPGPRDVVAAFGSRILEVKHAGTLPPWIQQLLAAFRPAPEHFSKFRIGMQALTQEHDLGEGVTMPRTPTPAGPQLGALLSTIVAA